MRRALIVLCLISVTSAVPANATGADALTCSEQLAGSTPMPSEDRKACVRAVASTYLQAQTNDIEPDGILLADDALRYVLGPKPDHRPDGATTIRASYPTDLSRITNEEWVIDGDVAYVSYDVFQGGDTRSLIETDRITLRDGLIWEILTNGSPPVSEDFGYPISGGVITSGVPADTTVHTGDHDDGAWCSMRISDGAEMTGEQRERCNTAIASTYVDSEQNTAPGWAILVDLRAANHSQGQTVRHRVGGGDQIRGRQGLTGPNMVIKRIVNREWHWDGDTGWIRYDGYTQFSLDRPDFYVIERFKIRHGLIWELMVPTVAVCPLGTNCFLANL